MSLIPGHAINSLEKRFELDKRNNGPKAWNAWSPNQEVLNDDAWVIDRLRHAISHCALALAKIQNPGLDDGDDDAGAIMWAGAMLAERRARKGQGADTPGQHKTEKAE